MRVLVYASLSLSRSLTLARAHTDTRTHLAVNSDTVDLGAIFRVPNMASPLSAKLSLAERNSGKSVPALGYLVYNSTVKRTLRNASLASGNGRFLAMYHGLCRHAVRESEGGGGEVG
jgi:hypothetical protein